MPELAPDEAFVAVMASAINFNTVWSSHLRAGPDLRFLERLGKESVLGQAPRPHYHVVGSDAAGRGRAGRARRCATGSRATRSWSTATTSTTRTRAPTTTRCWRPTSASGASRPTSAAWPTSALVKANQLMPKPAHLTWEEAAGNALCNSTSYRMLVSRNGAGMKQGDTVLVWGATGGLGGYAIQYVLNGGGTPVGVVSSPEKAAILRALGCEAVIDRRAGNYQFWADDQTPDESEWRRFGKAIRACAARTRRSSSSTRVVRPSAPRCSCARRGGTIVTCAATSGYPIEYDNRHLWMKLKTIKGSHFANYREAWDANRLVAKGKIHPILSVTYPLEQTGEAAYQVHRNLHEGKIGVRCLAPADGLGVDDPEFRAKVGEDKITLFRRAGA